MGEREAILEQRSALASGAWLTADRARAYLRLLLALELVTAAVLLLTRHGLLDLLGRPLGSDFISFWAASKLVLSGHPAAVYDPAQHHAVETALIGAPVGYFAWFYPPVALLLVAPLSLIPYGPALVLWLGATFAGYAAVVRRFIARAGAVIPAVGFPAVFVNLTHGQNGLLSTALVGAGLLLSETRPLAGGALLGCLCYKPQLAPMLAVVVLASRRWRMALGAVASIALLAGAATLAFGTGIWPAFMANLPLARASVEDGLVGFDKMQSLFAAVRLLGGGPALAYGCQAAISAGAAVLLWQVWRSEASLLLRGGATAAAILLGTPFLLDYDLVLLALPLAALADAGLSGRFLPFEKTVLAAAWVAPLFARDLSQHLHLPLVPPLVLLLLVLFWRRARG